MSIFKARALNGGDKSSYSIRRNIETGALIYSNRQPGTI